MRWKVRGLLHMWSFWTCRKMEPLDEPATPRSMRYLLRNHMQLAFGARALPTTLTLRADELAWFNDAGDALLAETCQLLESRRAHLERLVALAAGEAGPPPKRARAGAGGASAAGAAAAAAADEAERTVAGARVVVTYEVQPARGVARALSLIHISEPTRPY